MNQTATGQRPDYFADQFDQSDFDNEPAARTTAEEQRKAAHIANGGEQTFKCPSCHGSGRFHTYSGRDGGACFKCKGKGAISKGQQAAIKGKATKEANRQAWVEENAAAIAYVHKRAAKGSSFYASFAEKMAEWGKLTDNQLALVERDMAKDAEFWAAKKAEREAAAPKIEISAIEKLFATAVDNDVKRPIFRAEGLEISKAPVTGRNAGALYVKREGEYAGKIVGGVFHKTFTAAADTTDLLMAVAADPTGAAMAYGRKFGNCGCCGRGLVDPVSIRAGIGPVCADNWGLDWRRDLARESLAADEAAEAGNKESAA